MGMKKCKECGEEVSSSAKSCPKCGKDQRNFFKKHPVLSVIGVLVVLGVILGSGGSSSNEPKNTLNNNTNANTENTTPTTPIKTEYVPGEIYEDDYMAVKFVSKNTNFTKYSKYADVKKTQKVIQATFEFENVGGSDQYVSSYEFECYADGYACEAFYLVDDSTFGTTLSAGKKTKGSVYFLVPKDAKEIEIEYETNVWTDAKIKFVVQ